MDYMPHVTAPMYLHLGSYWSIYGSCYLCTYTVDLNTEILHQAWMAADILQIFYFINNFFDVLDIIWLELHLVISKIIVNTQKQYITLKGKPLMIAMDYSWDFCEWLYIIKCS